MYTKRVSVMADLSIFSVVESIFAICVLKLCYFMFKDSTL